MAEVSEGGNPQGMLDMLLQPGPETEIDGYRRLLPDQGSPFEHLIPEASTSPVAYTSNGTVGRVCTERHPMGEPAPEPEYFFEAAPTAEEMRAAAERAEQEYRERNNVFLWACGPVLCSGGVAVRALGGPEWLVDEAAQSTFGALTPTGAGAMRMK